MPALLQYRQKRALPVIVTLRACYAIRLHNRSFCASMWDHLFLLDILLTLIDGHDGHMARRSDKIFDTSDPSPEMGQRQLLGPNSPRKG